MEPGTGLTILGAALGSEKIIEKLLGPTAEYLGDGLQLWAARRVDNVAAIFGRARKLLGPRLEEPGAVPPKVLQRILQEGSVAEDELTSCYFAGILAASRSDAPRDDRGAAFAALVGRLTTYQVRGHFTVYDTLRQVYSGQTHSPTVDEGRRNLRVFIPEGTLRQNLALAANEDLGVILPHVLWGLLRESLLDDHMGYGSAENLRPFFPAAPVSGAVVGPSPLGVELYLWAHGCANVNASQFLAATSRLTLQVPAASVASCIPYRRIADGA